MQSVTWAQEFNESREIYMDRTPIDMTGKVCLITGGTSGIGWVTASRLAQFGASVILVGRNRRRGRLAVSRLRDEHGIRTVEFIQTDLSSLQEVRDLVEEFHNRYDRLDILVNNAGTTLLTRRMSPDGYEMTLAVNHLSHFLLTNLLLDTLKSSAPSRVIHVSSGSHRRAGIQFDDLQSAKRYWIMDAYGQSKLANVLFAYELARRVEGTGITSNAVHPGFVSTNMGRDNGWFIHKLIRLAMRFSGISPEEGAQTILYLATSPEVECVSGKYFYEMKPLKSSAHSYDLDTARRLWQVSEQLVGLLPSQLGLHPA
jgi:NAD(P)-dependent dehydrogenase (short-subunit alcohol dehydrogenase family)